MSIYDENLPIPIRHPLPTSLLPKTNPPNPLRPKLSIKHSRSTSNLSTRSIRPRAISGVSGISGFTIKEDGFGEFGELQKENSVVEGDISVGGDENVVFGDSRCHSLGGKKESGDLEGRLKGLEKALKGFERGMTLVKGNYKTVDSRVTTLEEAQADLKVELQLHILSSKNATNDQTSSSATYSSLVGDNTIQPHTPSHLRHDLMGSPMVPAVKARVDRLAELRKLTLIGEGNSMAAGGEDLALGIIRPEKSVVEDVSDLMAWEEDPPSTEGVMAATPAVIGVYQTDVKGILQEHDTKLNDQAQMIAELLGRIQALESPKPLISAQAVPPILAQGSILAQSDEASRYERALSNLLFTRIELDQARARIARLESEVQSTKMNTAESPKLSLPDLSAKVPVHSRLTTLAIIGSVAVLSISLAILLRSEHGW